MESAAKDPVGNPVGDYKERYEALLLTLSEKEEEHRRITTEKDEQIAQLHFELDKFRRYLFGSKSEQLPATTPSDPAQMSLFDLGVPEADQQILGQQVEPVTHTQKQAARKRAKGTGRMKLPEQLRREEIIIEPTADTTDCIHIGDEICEVLDVVPAELYVKRYIRRKYAQPNGEGILIGALPERVVDKGIPSNRLVGEMMIDKYVYGLPLHRQIDKYRRLGVNIPASTASDWMMKGWKHLAPLWELLKRVVVNQHYIQADESPIKVQERSPGKKKGIHKGYMWVYHAPANRLVLYDYQPGRDQSGPKALLKNFKGILQTDGYKVYESLYGNHPAIALVYCMAHARRKFIEALNDDRLRATHVLELMGQLYALEKEMREEKLTWEERTSKRQEIAVPLLKQIQDWLQKHVHTVLPKSPLGQAIHYTLPRWKGLSAYAQHGQIEIDNNLVENAIRPLAIGRKNFLFAGSKEAAEMTAALYSFMATCKKNGVNEQEWIADVLERGQTIKHKELYQLLPNNWEKYKPSQ
jgi:transposase